MSSGKSYLSQKIISNLQTITYSEKHITKTEIIFISKSYESSITLKNICQKNSFDFSWWKIIHPTSQIIYKANDKKHIIILMEDISGDINNADSKFNAEMSSFMYQSRHYNISIIYILHGISHAMTKRNSFERLFLDNVSGLFIFKPVNNKKIIYNYLRNFLNKSTYDQLDEVFSFCSKIMSHPYIFLQPHKNLDDEISKIRLDIFGKNIFLQSGV